MPAAQMLLPTAETLQMIVGELMEMPELIPQIGNPQNALLNILASQVMGGGKNAAQMPMPNEPPGMLPPQANGDY